MKPMMILFGLVSLVWAGGELSAAPSSNVVWDSPTRALLKSGDPEKGKTLAAACAACHGENGISENPGFPSLAGQLATYLFKQLKDYKDNKRSDNPMMLGIASPLSEQDMADIAAFYSSQPLPPGIESAGDNEAAKMLVTRGDGVRLVPPCAACHGRSGDGKIVDIPALAGQQVEYVKATLLAYKEGKRSNDIYSRMRLIAQQLSENEITALANYYTGLGD